MRQQWTCPEVHAGRHGLENITEDVRPGKDAAAGLPMILFVVGQGGLTRGRARASGAVLTLAVVALQVVLQAGRLGASIIAMRAAIRFLS